MSYNGWTNYVTWNVNLWIMNTEPWYRAWIRYRRNWTAQSAQSFVENLLPTGTPDMDHHGAYHGVNWQELAEAWNES